MNYHYKSCIISPFQDYIILLKCAFYLKRQKNIKAHASFMSEIKGDTFHEIELLYLSNILKQC